MNLSAGAAISPPYLLLCVFLVLCSLGGFPRRWRRGRHDAGGGGRARTRSGPSWTRGRRRLSWSRGWRKRLCFSVFTGVAFFFFVRCFAGRLGVLPFLPPSGTDKQESHQTSLLKGEGGRVLFCSKYEFNDFPPSYSSLRGRAIIMMTIRHPYILNRNRTIPLSINY